MDVKDPFTVVQLEMAARMVALETKGKGQTHEIFLEADPTSPDNIHLNIYAGGM